MLEHQEDMFAIARQRHRNMLQTAAANRHLKSTHGEKHGLLEQLARVRSFVLTLVA